MSTTHGNTKSKSKTFRKGEEVNEIHKWINNNILIRLMRGSDKSPLAYKYVITITRYVDKNNNCTLCGRPVGNTVFTVCDDCWDKKEQK